MRTVKYQLLRPEEILEEKRRKSIVYLPVGPLEWHGPAMPVGTDPIAAEAVALGVAQKTGGVVVPTLYFGTEKKRDKKLLNLVGLNEDDYIVGMDFPKNSMKSSYTTEDVFGFIVREQLRLLVRQKYKLIVIVNGHGATNQNEMLQLLSDEFSGETGSRVVVLMGIAKVRDDDHNLGHATKAETAMQMYLSGDSVDLSKLPPKNQPMKMADFGMMDCFDFEGSPNAERTVISDPREATAELGKAYVDKAIEHLAEKVEKYYNEIVD